MKAAIFLTSHRFDLSALGAGLFLEVLYSISYWEVSIQAPPKKKDQAKEVFLVT
jgi:hypothetical protein